MALVEVVERNGGVVEVRDRHRRLKTTEVVLVADPSHPRLNPDPSARSFAAGAQRRRWSTIVARFGGGSVDVALQLVRAGIVHLACRVDSLGRVGQPSWWQLTPEAADDVAHRRALAASKSAERASAQRALADEVRPHFPALAAALEAARSTTAAAIIAAASEDVLAGIDHAGPRAFTQAHFAGTKVHDVVGILRTAGVPVELQERLGLRRGDRIGLGGPIAVTTSGGSVDLAPLRGPVVIRLDQPGLALSTAAEVLVILENLQPTEAVCARYPALAVVYTAGQFGDDTADLLAQLTASSRRVVAIVDADLGGIRIARRILRAVPDAEVIDVGTWPHPPRPTFDPHGASARGLGALLEDPGVGWFAAAVLERDYPVEQELATLNIVETVLDSEPASR